MHVFIYLSFAVFMALLLSVAGVRKVTNNHRSEGATNTSSKQRTTKGDTAFSPDQVIEASIGGIDSNRLTMGIRFDL